MVTSVKTSGPRAVLPNTSARRSVLVPIVACFALSGFAALLYQTAWLRQFSVVFGTSELAVATVLAAYMGGLACGAAVAVRLLTRVTRPVLVYGLLEAGIALSALAVPLLLAGASSLYVSLLGGQPTPPSSVGGGQAAFYLVVAFVILALPTGFMGATLPLLIRHAVRSDAEIGPRVALLYAANTFGAVGGALVAGFLLLPTLGLRGTVWIGVGVNVIVFLIAAGLARRLPKLSHASVATEQQSSRLGFWRACVAPLLSWSDREVTRMHTVFTMQRAWVLPIMLFSGAAAFLYEVLWTRLLTHVLGGSVYAFVTMLAAFLTGIALGGGLTGRFAKDAGQAARYLGWSQLAIAALSMLIYARIEAWVPVDKTLAANATFAALVLLPATIFIGATFPLAVRVLSRDETQADASTAQVYAWNTVGAIGGAIGAGFFLIPALGFEGAVKLGVLVNLTLALATFAFVAERRRVHWVATTVLVVLTVVLYQPTRPDRLVTSAVFTQQRDAVNADEPADQQSDELFFAVGRSSTVLLLDRGGYFDLLTNGLPEASIYARGAPPVKHSQRWLTALPVAARPDTRSMLVIGFGGGVALEGAPSSVDDIDVIELEPEVINANRVIGDLRQYDPLRDPRVNVVINDARNALRLTSKRYDVIVSQPSHPWTAGASHLFTREFASLAKSHLNKDGVFLQWMNAEFVDERLLRSLAATLLDVFPNVRLYKVGPTVLLFLASEGPLDLERQLVRTGKPLTEHLFHYSQIAINGVNDFFVALSVDEAGMRRMAALAAVSTDDHNLMALQSAYRGDGLDEESLATLLARYDPLLDPDSWIYQDFSSELKLGYIGSRLIHTGDLRRANRLANRVQDPSIAMLIHGYGMAYTGDEAKSRNAMLAALHIDPSNVDARYALVKSGLASLVSGSAPEQLKAIAAELGPGPAAVPEGWRYGAEKNWQALARLESRLAPTEPTDAWYPEAVQLRAEWRTKVADQVLSENLAYDAIRLVDRALLIAPDLDLYVLRAACAYLLDDAQAFVESARYVGWYIRSKVVRAKAGRYIISAREMSVIKARLNGLARQLAKPIETRVAERAQAVRDEIGALLVEIEGLDPNAREGPSNGSEQRVGDE